MKYYLSLVNTSIPFGKGLNALAHTAIGIGNWIPNDKMPNIAVLFANEEIIREFRQAILKMLLTHSNEIIYSDFTNTMTVGLTDNCIKETKETNENQLIYYAISICIEKELLESQPLKKIISRCKTLKNYEPYVSEENESDFDFKKISAIPNYQSLPTKKLSLTLDRTGLPEKLINAAIISSLSIGMQATLDELKLVVYLDADNQTHPYISYHPFPVLAARQQSKFNELARTIEIDQTLLKKVLKDKNGNTVSICLLGNEDQVNTYTRQKFISLWTAELQEDIFIPNLFSFS